MKNRRQTTKETAKDLDVMLAEICQKINISDYFSEMKVYVEKVIAERKSSSHVSDEKLKATITI